MPTKYAAQIKRAQAGIRRRGGPIDYTSVVGTQTPNDPSRPFEIGTPVDPTNDPNKDATPLRIYAVFLDAKARGSDTQGMVAEFVRNMDIAAGNKLALIAGQPGIDCKIGDTINRNVEGRTGYPLYKIAKFRNLDIDGAVILWALELEL